MKLKVKWGNQRQIVDLGDRGVGDVTLGDLKQAVLTQFHFDDREIQLGLNKQDVFQGEESVLSSFGLVSGDLVHVIGNLPLSTQSATASVSSGTSSSSNAVYQTAYMELSEENELAQVSLIGGPSTNTDISSQSDDHISPDASFVPDLGESDESLSVNNSQVNRYLTEPLVLRESNASQVPPLLSQLYTCADCSGATDALWLAIHCLMLESGFSVQAGSENCMPNEWRRPGYYRCEYNYYIVGEVKGQCAVTGVTLGNTVAVHGVTMLSAQTFNTETVHLSAPQYVRGLNSNIPAVYRCLDRLSLVVKDKICLPLVNEISTAAGYREEQGLLSLPREVLIRVTSRLDAQSLCRLGQTCQELNGACTDKAVWRRLYLQDFPQPRDTSLGQDWYQLYKLALLEKKLREESDRMHQRMIWDRHVFEPQRPFGRVPRHPFPFLIGGEHDLNPEFAPEFDPGLNRIGQNLRRHDSNRLLRPLTRGNLTGSPFSRSSFF